LNKLNFNRWGYDNQFFAHRVTSNETLTLP
jgi:hypothetical protein